MGGDFLLGNDAILKICREICRDIFEYLNRPILGVGLGYGK